MAFIRGHRYRIVEKAACLWGRRTAGWLWGMVLLGGVGCASQVIEIPVRIPTQAQIPLNDYDVVVVVPFLTYRDFQGVEDDPSIDYGEEVRSIVRNELQSHLSQTILVSHPAEGRPSKVDLPDPTAWLTPAIAEQWIQDHLQGLAELEHATRPAVVFGVVTVQGILREGAVPREEYPPRPPPPGTIPQEPAPDRRNVEVRASIRFFLFDWSNRRVLYSEAVEESLQTSLRRMHLGAFYVLLDRILPKLLSKVVPIYIQTERILVQGTPEGRP
ncbi:MAG: hypothetical protein NZ742_07590 [Acidobacteria bacterium]|nr:hypothetical protein [Acidobacteriota bacterium]MDW7984734.1 hypothetical protein [Acidobacteriota bacterium]